MKRKIQVSSTDIEHRLSPKASLHLKCRRPTSAPMAHKVVHPRLSLKLKEKADKQLRKIGIQFIFHWWERHAIKYQLRHPHVRARLERLMGSNLVRLTDRKYMVHLQERIREDYLEVLEKRMKERSETEMARQKHLVLTGLIPFDQAPKEMYDHPVLVIERYCNKVIADRRAKIKVPKVVIPKLLFLDDSPDASTALTIGNGHWYNPENKTLITPQHYLESHEDDVEKGYMFTDEEYDKLHYETPLVRDMRQLETIDELYYIAEQILGSVSNMPPPKG